MVEKEVTMQRNNRMSLKSRRKQLRNDPTPAEKLLWSILKKVNLLKESQLGGHKFRRQHSYGPYVMDFFCPSKCLCIELDGESHDTPESEAHDRIKDSYLRTHHIKVLRITNKEVYANVENVLGRI